MASDPAHLDSHLRNGARPRCQPRGASRNTARFYLRLLSPLEEVGRGLALGLSSGASSPWCWPDAGGPAQPPLLRTRRLIFQPISCLKLSPSRTELFTHPSKLVLPPEFPALTNWNPQSLTLPSFLNPIQCQDLGTPLLKSHHLLPFPQPPP